jgi:hypothetical protein
MQLARIERRKARLRRLRQKLSSQHVQDMDVEHPRPQANVDSATTDATRHHHIGVSETLAEHIGTFLRNHSGDPAVKVLLFPDHGAASHQFTFRIFYQS